MYISLLETIASISGTLIGFVGIVFIFGRRAEGKLNKREQSGLFHLLYTSMGALLFSLLMLVALAEFGNDLIVWRIGTGFVVLNFFYGAYKAFSDEKQKTHGLPNILGWAFPSVAVAVLVMNGLCTFGILVHYSQAAFCLAMIMLIFICLAYFLAMLISDLSSE